MEHNANERNSFGQTALMTACTTGNITAVREILEWRDHDGNRVDINARDENGQTALSFAKQSNNAEIVAMIGQNLFLRAVENGDTDAVKTYLTAMESNFEVLYCREETNILARHHGQNSVPLEILSPEDDPTPKRFKVGIETEFTSTDSITRSVWLEAVVIAQRKCHDKMLNLLFNDDRFIHVCNEDGQTILHQIVAEYLSAEYYSKKLGTIKILLKFRKFSGSSSNFQNQTILEYVCKIKPKQCGKIYALLRIFHENRIDLNGRNRNGETFLMLACQNRRFDIVHSLIKLAAHGFVLDIDAVDNSGETALMKAKQNYDSKIVAALLGKKLISSVKDVKEDAMLKAAHFLLGFNEDELSTFYELVAEYLEVDAFFTNMDTANIFLKSWKYNANVLNLRHETIFEIICKVNSEYYYYEIGDLLQIILHNGFDLNGRNKNGETFLMLACKNRSINLVRSLLDLASHGFVLDIDAVDNSGETALVKAKEKNFNKIVVVLLKFQFISAVKNENADIVKSMLAEFRNTLDIYVKSWSSRDQEDVSKKREEKSDIWIEAIKIAMQNDTKHSDKILKLLLDCDILLSQDIETGYSVFDRLMQRWKDDDDKRLRLIELLLKSGKLNANDRDKDGRTALHWAKEEKLTSILIRYGADVNRKDNEGKTPLMHISGKVGEKIFPVLRTLLEEAGALVNLDAMDCNGRTALMYAVMWHRPHDVELLLNKGASVNVSDYLGFTALHYVLHDNINEHFNCPRNSEELKNIKEIAILVDTEKHEHLWRIEKWSEERRKIVEMLLKRPDIDVNLLSIEMFSPFDIAEGQIPDLPSSIKSTLKEKGAVLNVFRQTESQSTSDFHLDFASLLTMSFKQFAKAVHIRKKFLVLIETFKKQKVADKDQRGRTALHLVVISFYDIQNADEDLANKIVDKLISLGCSVNDTDIYGCTPLHYANELFWKLLISKGADASVKDKDGNIAIEERWHRSLEASSYIVRKAIYRFGETYLLRLMNNKHMEINVQCADDSDGDSNTDGDSDGDSVPEFWRELVNLEAAPRLLWEKGKYAYRHPVVKQITEEVTYLMDAIAKEIERLDPRFGIRLEFVGSSNEGTKIDKPDEFDFCFVLTKFSELCEVSLSPELPTGFVRLKRKPTKAGETSDFDSFFGKDGILNTVKLNWQFASILRHTLDSIDSKLNFQWILELEAKNKHILDFKKKVVTIKMIKPLNFFPVNSIMVDIAPCIHIDDWWPDEGISNVSDEMKKFGCNLVLDCPQELYPWVRYTESCARISFAKAESDMVKQSCGSAREAYMIGKTMIEKSYDVVKQLIGETSNAESKYILKNCLLYCIEALSPSSEKASQLGLSLEEMNSKFLQMDRYLWLKCLMKCHLEFVAQDFCPCYFLPTFSSCSLVIEFESKHCLKNIFFDWIADHGSTFPESCKKACALYRCASNDISKSSYQLSAPNPLWERFDRKQLIASLCEIAYK